MKMEDDLDLEVSWLGTLSDQEDFHELTFSFAQDNQPCTPTTGRVTSLHQTPGRQEGEKLLAEVPELEFLSTTMEDGLVGDQPWPTVDTSTGPRVHDMVEQTSFVRGEILGVSQRQEMQGVMVEGCWGGQTTRQSVHSVVLEGGEDNKTSPTGLDRCAAGPSSGETQQIHGNTSNSCLDYDIIDSSSDVPGCPTVRIY